MNTQPKHLKLTAGFCLLMVLFFSCKKNKENTDLPKLTTSAITYIGDKSATGSGGIESVGASEIIVAGICWSTSHSPTNSGNKVNLKKATLGDFSCILSGLTANTTYYVRAFAMNRSGTAYGNEVSFTTTAPLPVLTTQPITDIISNTAISGGNITSNGGSDITERGICWSTNPVPYIEDNKTTNGAGTGSFLSSITGLTNNNTYYVRAYATTSVGTAYGNTVLFVLDIDGNGYTTVTIGNQTWMVQNLKTTRYQNGEAIPNVTNDPVWNNLTTGAYCNYKNKDSLAAIYGRLYNWYAVNDNRIICPPGWHVPTTSDFTNLSAYLGSLASGKLKEAGTAHWESPNTDATNSSGFTALPGGDRYDGGQFQDLYTMGNWWSADPYDNVLACYMRLYSYDGSYQFSTRKKTDGNSIRCIHD